MAKRSHRWAKETSQIAQVEGGRQKWEQGLRVRGGRDRCKNETFHKLWETRIICTTETIKSLFLV